MHRAFLGPLLAGLALGGLASSQLYLAHAWETDQLSGRVSPPDDVTAVANARVNHLMDQAAAEVNDRYGCAGDGDKLRKRVEKLLWKLTAPRTPVAGFGPFRGSGHGAYSAWLEASELDHRSFHFRGDIFGGMQMRRGPILSMVGVCTTYQIAGVLMGTDKPDHFFSTGYEYLKRAQRKGEDAAIAFGTHTERTIYGWQSSATFSFGDLHANLQGYRFFRSLWEGDDPYYTFDAQGCVSRRRDFDWADWADWRWDEVYNPSVYKPAVQAWLDGHLEEHADRLCLGAEDWLPEVQTHLATALAEQGDYFGEKAPPRTDPFRLDRLCGRSAD
jgi:hypothetical protein